MHEEEFRRRFREAVGRAPDEAGAVGRAAASLAVGRRADDRRGGTRAAALVAAAIGLVLVAGLLGLRAARMDVHSPLTPAARPGPVLPSGIAQAAVATCLLPLVVTDASAAVNARPTDPMTYFDASPNRVTGGFVSLATGRFQADAAAAGRGMPFTRMYVSQTWQPVTYDPVIGRWLSEPSTAVSPDHRSYVYVLYAPLAVGKGSTYSSSSLHRYDVLTGRDRTLWTYPGSITAAWTADGIYAQTMPAHSGTLATWVVDPTTGAARPDSAAVPQGMDLQSAISDFQVGPNAALVGRDGQGRSVLLEGTRQPGSPQTYFVAGPNDQRIVIHQGVMGDALDFDPSGFTADGDRLWAANMDATAVWLWTQSGGLRRFALSGVPARSPYVWPRVAGPCV